jgi:hypothetical protein
VFADSQAPGLSLLDHAGEFTLTGRECRSDLPDRRAMRRLLDIAFTRLRSYATISGRVSVEPVEVDILS